LGIASIAAILFFSMLMVESYAENKFSKLVYRSIRALAPAKVMAFADKTIDALELFRHDKNIIFKTLLFSISLHTWLGVNLLIVGKCVNENAIGLTDYLLTTQVGNMISAFPITPGGAGVRDIGSAMILQTLGASPGMAGVIPIFMTLIIIGWRLLGCVFFGFSNFIPKEID
jgi:uncharacterized membrane protein YbhN (UPF0104 family)